MPLRADLPDVDDEVFCVHYPNGAVKKLSPPHPGFSKVEESSLNSIVCSLDITGGSSGSGLFDTSGRYLGILSALETPCPQDYLPLTAIWSELRNLLPWFRPRREVAIDPLALILPAHVYVKLTLPDPPPYEVLAERVRRELASMSSWERAELVERLGALSGDAAALAEDIRRSMR